MILCGVREKHTTDSLIWGCRTNIAFTDMGSQCMIECIHLCSFLFYVQAILCAGSPNIPFMADESIQAIPRFGNVKIDYTLKFYLCYLESIRSCLKVLLSKG